MDVMISGKIVSSKSDFRRLIEGGAITRLEDNTKIEDFNQKSKEGVYRVGKKRFVKIIF